tara:strand:+ start:66 stop:584 length:519 start_codon:yes stop_codon:yes gene_type:complete
MTYLRALQLMVSAYKAAKGFMPKGLDLLKIKMKARQKAIDSVRGKIIQFPPERITNPFKARPQPPKTKIIKGIKTERGLGDLFKKRMENIGKKFKKKESEAETIARMNRQNKEAAQRLRDKKKPREDKAEGGVASAIKKIKKRFGKKSITTANKIKRPGNRQLFEEFNKRNR